MSEGKKQGLDINRVVKASSLVMQVGLSAICPIFILMGAGMYLDDRFGPGRHWFLFAGIVCGIYSAYRSTYFLIRDTMRLKDEKKVDNEKNI